jgi:ubiquinone/menaquinone biosynthesis C-methylase UbiE
MTFDSLSLSSYHFIHSVARIYCVEPSEGMRLFAVQRFSNNIEFVSVDGSSESTKLLTNLVNIILVGQALHYFNSEQTLMEFQRICIPHGWLATLAIVLADKELEKATKGIFTENNGCNVRLSLYKPQKVPINYYFPNGCTRYTYSHIHEETFEQFLGGLCSSADAPLISNPLFVNFKRDARKIFDSFRISEDKITIPLYTELSLGQLNA